MKKHLLTITALLAAVIGHSQTWSENFNSTTSSNIPSNWLQQNVDGNTVSSSLASLFGTKAWVTYDFSSTFPGYGKSAVSTSVYSPAGTSNDWLITPSFTVPANAYFQWEALAGSPSSMDGYTVKISTTGTLTTDFSNTLLTVPAETASGWNARNINLNSYTGQVVRIAFVNNSTNKYLLLLDNVSLVSAAANDIKIATVTPTGNDGWSMTGTTKTIGGTITNNGYNAITTFTAKYSDGTAIQSNVFTGLNLAYGQAYTFTLSTPFSISGPTQTNLKVWSEFTGDSNLSNDTLNTLVGGYTFLPNHKVVFEEGTGTWCGWCVRGAVYMDSMHHVNPNSTVLIAVHNADPMVVTAYDAGVNNLISGYPQVLCARSAGIGDPSDMFTFYNDHINDFGFADLTLTSTFNPTTRLATINVDTKMATTFTNNTPLKEVRLTVVFTEDHVTGTTSNYNQRNYYSGGGQGPMVGAGHNFELEPDPVPAANIKYDFVARALLGGFSGLANSLPNNLVAGASTSNTFTYTVPSNYNIGNMKAHAMIIDTKSNVIYNANSILVDPSAVGVKEAASETIAFSLYPNPTSSTASVQFILSASETVSINIYNTLGTLVYSDVKSNLQAGQNDVHLNLEGLANGLYTVSVSTGKEIATKKLTIYK